MATLSAARRYFGTVNHSLTLSLWTGAVQANPDDTEALTSRALAYLHLSPPETDKALADLERALQLSQGNQNK